MLDQFVNKYNGQSVLYAPSKAREYLRGQCVQLVCFYVTEVLGTPVVWRDAADWWHSNLFPEIYQRVGLHDMRRGDIVIWDASLPNSGGSGHIGILLSDNSAGATFVSFDSNWGGKYARAVSHNKSWVIGGLRKRGVAPAPPQQGDEMIVNHDQAAKIYRLLRPNAGASQAELDATAGRRSFAEFLNSAQPEVIARDAHLVQQNYQIQHMSNLINELNAVIAESKRLEALEDQTEVQQLSELKVAREKIAELTAKLETSHDKIVEIQNNPPAPMSTINEPSWFVKFLAALLKRKA